MKLTWDEVRTIAQHPNVLAFGRVLREGETNQTDSAWQMRYGGVGQKPKYFDSFADHPRIFEATADGKQSSAAGAYQIVATTWSDFTKVYGFQDFSPENQTRCMVWLIDRAGALEDVIEGRLDAAIRKLPQVWTSLALPKIQAKAQAIFTQYGGKLSREGESGSVPRNPNPTPAKAEVKMAPLVIPILETLVPLIPQLGKLFGSGSEVANRNVAAASLAADALVKVTSSVNLQEAAEKIHEDPDLLSDAKQVIGKLVLELQEVGGGIPEARKIAYSPDQPPVWKNPAFLIALTILPLVYMTAAAILFGAGGQTWSDDIKTLFVTAIVTGGLGAVTGFFLGSSLSSQRKDALLAK